MSLTRLLCEKCGWPEVYCMCTKTSDTIEPTEAEASVLAELFSTTRRQSNLAILRAYRDAEVAKATGELLKDKERLDWLAAQFWRFREETNDEVAFRSFTLCMKPGVPECPVNLRDAIDAARAQQKDTP